MTIDETRLRLIRAHFPIFETKIYLNSCSQGALSRTVEASLEEYVESWDSCGSPWDKWISKYEELRCVFARFIGAEANEVAMVPSASAAINAIASALDFGDRNQIVMGEFEFPTMGHIWLAQQKRGAHVEFVPASGNEIPDIAYEHAIGRRTAIVPLTHVCFMNGFRSRVKAIREIAHNHGALLMLDDYQDCGTRPIDVKELGVDCYVTGALKYLLGPPGVAFLYVRDDLIKELLPTISGWFAQRNPFAFDTKRFDPAPSARRFEAGTPCVPSVYGALAALRLLESFELEAVCDHISALARHLMKGATQLGIECKTPSESAGPLVVLGSRNVERLLNELARRGIIASSRHDGLRISFHAYNTAEDVRTVLQVLQDNLSLMAREKKHSLGGAMQ